MLQEFSTNTPSTDELLLQRLKQMSHKSSEKPLTQIQIGLIALAAVKNKKQMDSNEVPTSAVNTLVEALGGMGYLVKQEFTSSQLHELIQNHFDQINNGG